jgi:hypothetical protein
MIYPKNLTWKQISENFFVIYRKTWEVMLLIFSENAQGPNQCLWKSVGAYKEGMFRSERLETQMSFWNEGKGNLEEF